MTRRRKIPGVSRRDRERFYAKTVINISCWEWIGAKLSSGYGSFGIGKQTYLAHRVAFYIEHGRDPVQCNHTCDNRSCVNPSHLYSGTQAQNVADMLERSKTLRANLSEAVAASHGKLDAVKVVMIRDAYKAGGQSCASLGKKFGVTASTIYCIVKRKTWKHVTAANAATDDGFAPRGKGENNGRAKLTEADVRAIRAEPRTHGFMAKLAREYGVSKPTIRNIIIGKLWAHVD